MGEALSRRRGFPEMNKLHNDEHSHPEFNFLYDFESILLDECLPGCPRHLTAVDAPDMSPDSRSHRITVPAILGRPTSYCQVPGTSAYHPVVSDEQRANQGYACIKHEWKCLSGCVLPQPGVLQVAGRAS